MSSKTVVVGGSTYNVQNAGRSYSLTMPIAGTLRFEVGTGDVWSGDPITKNRSEIGGWTRYAADTQINVSYGFKLEPGGVNTAAWIAVGQFHQVTVDSNSPPFSIGLTGNKMTIGIEYNNASGKIVYSPLYQDAQTIVAGHQYSMKIQATFDTNNHGHLLVVRDGVTLVDYVGSLGFVGMGGVYWKEGIYRAAATGDIAVDFSNLSVTSTSANLTLKPTPPTVSFTQTLGFDSGHSNSDDISTNGFVTLKGVATAGAFISVMDGSTVIGTTQANGLGVWTLNSTLGEGRHTLSAGATLGGLTTWFANPDAVVIDNRSPGSPPVPILSPDNGLSTNDNVTNSAKLTISGTSEANAIISVYADGVLEGHATAGVSGAWTFSDVNHTFADGSHWFAAVATDLAGNSSAWSPADSLVIDTIAPKNTVSSISQTSSTFALGGWSQAGGKVALTEGAATMATATIASSGAWSATIHESQSSVHTYVMTTEDKAGNLANPVHVIVGSAGANTLTSQAAGNILWGGDGGDTFVLTPSTTNGTMIGFFQPNHDHIDFKGFDTGSAHLSQVDSTHWKISDNAHSDVFQVANSSALHASDYFFG